MDNVKHIYHVYAIRTKKRDEIFKRLEANGVGVIVHYPIALHLQRAYQSLGYKKGDFPVSENVAKEIISLPMFPHLREKQIEFIVGLIKKTLDK
jgi:dTDP-4-amino-4,6-dideoxygalactose transaminase